MTRLAWGPMAFVAGLLALLTYLLLESRSPDLDLRSRMYWTLQSFDLHDAELTRDVLLARAGLLPNYDSLVLASQQLGEDVATLRAQSQTASDPSARVMLGERVDALAGAAQEKLIQVDYFKSDNALLRNSLAYLSHSQALMQTRQGASKAVGDQVLELSRLLLRFVQTPGPELGMEIRSVLDRLSKTAGSEEESPLPFSHGRLILDALPRVDALMREIIGGATTAQTRALQKAVLQHSGRVEARAQIYRYLLYGVSVILLAYLVYQFLKLRANAVALRATNESLNREIAERVQAETDLRTSEEHLRAITDSAKEAIMSIDNGGNIVSWNAGAANVFGYQPVEVLGMPLTTLLPERAHAKCIRTLGQWVKGDGEGLFADTVEMIGLHKDGAKIPLEISISTWATPDGQFLAIIMRDIGPRKRLEERTRQQELQLIQANKMTAVGTLVSGVAHEINNPNQVVLLNSRVLAEAWEDAVEILDDHARGNARFMLGGLPYGEMRQTIGTLLHDVHDAALRIERIVTDLKDYARPRVPGKHDTFDLNQSAGRASRLLAHLVSKRTAHFQLDLAPSLPPVRGDPQQIEQVIVNLLANAVEALPDRERAVSMSTRVDDEGRAILEVWDEGVGIAREHLERLCDPFFTTKQDSGGTGLGLAITASLVRSHGARLDFDSEPGRGTRARVTFPHCMSHRDLVTGAATAAA
ncbi:MAG: DAHL domain-containing protein [Rhodocyclaceae bacterium]